MYRRPLLSLALLSALLLGRTSVAADVDPAIWADLAAQGRAQIIVNLLIEDATDRSATAQAEHVRAAQQALLDALATRRFAVQQRFQLIPALALEVDENTLRAVAAQRHVVSIECRCRRGGTQDTTLLPVDSTAKLIVVNIEVTGNRKTKKYIIEREMRFKTGDTIPAAQVYQKLEESRQLIYNTNLFADVSLVPAFVSGEGIKVIVTVKERWYIYPTPQFQLSDRNFNEWIERYNADLNRVTYGIKFAHYNLSGRRDQLRVFLLNGFSRNISVIYSAPYSNRNLTEGFAVSGGFSQIRAAIFSTNSNNLPLRYSRTDRDFVRQNLFVSGSYISRRGYYRRHIFSVGYSYNKVEDSVVTKYNPSYSNNGNKETQLTSISAING